MDIKRTAIYELPMNGKALKYASSQRFATTRGMKSILVIADKRPPVECRALKEGAELDEREAAWAMRAVAEIADENRDKDTGTKMREFLEKLEKELEKKEKGGGEDGE